MLNINISLVSVRREKELHQDIFYSSSWIVPEIMMICHSGKDRNLDSLSKEVNWGFFVKKNKQNILDKDVI